MPALGEDDAGQSSGAEPVSMPSLDDDAEAGEGTATQEEVDAAAAAAGNTGGEGGVPMEIDDMQNSVEGGEQLKFIVNENGQLLQLDNHILTDAEGNQIIVQGADSEHLQQLLQSVAGLEGGTIQMIQGENNQMILVQQDGNEPQLIDASMLNAEGQLVLQQAGGDMSQDGTEEQQQQQHEQEMHGGEQQHEQEQVQYAEAEVGDEQAHQEAVAVLAAGLLQAEAESTGAVDESSQEDLGSGQQVTGGEEEQSQEAHEEQQQEVCQAADETSQDEEQQAVSAVGGGEEGEEVGMNVDEGVAMTDEGSQEAEEGEAVVGGDVSQDGGDKEGAAEEGEGSAETQEDVTTTTTATEESVEEKITSTTEEGEAVVAGGDDKKEEGVVAAVEQKEGEEFF